MCWRRAGPAWRSRSSRVVRFEQRIQHTKRRVKRMRVCVVTDVGLHRCLTHTTLSPFISSRDSKTHRVSIAHWSHLTNLQWHASNTYACRPSRYRRPKVTVSEKAKGETPSIERRGTLSDKKRKGNKSVPISMVYSSQKSEIIRMRATLQIEDCIRGMSAS